MTRANQLWRDAIARNGRAERQRVVPLPLTFAALLVPFLAAWATAGPPGEAAGPKIADSGSRAQWGIQRDIQWDTLGRELPDDLTAVGRADRIPTDPNGYVDVWGPLTEWEADFVRRR